MPSGDVGGAPRRGRPPGFDRQAALDCLLGLFWRQGYDGATQEAMLTATGLSSSSLYRAFGTKPEIFTAALRRYLELAEDVLGPLEQGENGRRDLERFLDRVEGQVRGAGSPGGCLVVMTMADPVNADPRVAELTNGHVMRMGTAIEVAVSRARRQGASLPFPERKLSAALLAGVLGVLACAAADTDVAVRLLEGVRALARAIR